MTIWRNIEKNKKLIQDAARSKAFIIFDTETTGIKKDDEIIEIAAQKCIYHKGIFQPYEELHEYIRPSKPIPPQATEVNGITDEMLKDKPNAVEIFPKIKSFMGEAPVIGAYNSGFDVRMTNNLYIKNGELFRPSLEVDLLKIAKDIFCEQKLKDHKLGTIANTYGVDEGISFHNARDDVRVTIRVLNAMVKDMQENGNYEHKQKMNVYNINYWPMFRGGGRLYLVTSHGPLYYDFKEDRWTPNNKTLDTSKFDMADVERQVFEIGNCSDYKELRKRCLNGDFDYEKKE